MARSEGCCNGTGPNGWPEVGTLYVDSAGLPIEGPNLRCVPSTCTSADLNNSAASLITSSHTTTALADVTSQTPAAYAVPCCPLFLYRFKGPFSCSFIIVSAGKHKGAPVDAALDQFRFFPLTLLRVPHTVWHGCTPLGKDCRPVTFDPHVIAWGFLVPSYAAGYRVAGFLPHTQYPVPRSSGRAVAATLRRPPSGSSWSRWAA